MNEWRRSKYFYKPEVWIKMEFVTYKKKHMYKYGSVGAKEWLFMMFTYSIAKVRYTVCWWMT